MTTGLFFLIGKLLDDLTKEPEPTEPDITSEAADMRKRGAELAVSLWEGEYSKWVKESDRVGLGDAWKHPDFSSLSLWRPWLTLDGPSWFGTFQGVNLDFSKSQQKRIQAVVDRLKSEREIGSITKLAEAIIARGEQK